MVQKSFSIDTRINQTNERLKVAQMGLQIERRGNKLSVRGILPPRPNSPRLNPHQQRISLGLPATPTGLKQAEQEVKIIAARILEKNFDWREYLRISGGGRLHQLDLESQIQAFHDYFLNQPERLSNPASTRATWQTAYSPYLRKLQAIAQERPNLTLVETILITVQTCPPNSRSRQNCCTALNAFATFMGQDIGANLKPLSGGYSPNRTQKRELPSDELIVATFDQIPNSEWQFVYGIMATYGLRNHEVFFCDFSNLQENPKDATVHVLGTTKTGSREVWPFYPEWIERFDLQHVKLPGVNTNLNHTTLQRIGHRITTQFRRYAIPFGPYNLRHAWAVRTIHFGLPDTVAARMMGHSVEIHTRTYHQWMTRRDQQLAVEAALNRNPRRAPH